MTESTRKHSSLNVRGYLIAGLLTLAPVIAVWMVFDFLLDILFQAGRPIASALASAIDAQVPAMRPWLADHRVQWVVAVLVALLVLYAIGAVASRVVGIRLLGLFERIITRIPLVEAIYSATKKLVGVLQQKPESMSRVVLVEFPHPGLWAIAFVMRTFPDANTGEEIAAIYVPTAPIPTAGYLQFVATKSLLPTDMSMDQAMTMILSGGAAAPDHLSLAAKDMAEAAK